MKPPWPTAGELFLAFACFALAAVISFGAFLGGFTWRAAMRNLALIMVGVFLGRCV